VSTSANVTYYTVFKDDKQIAEYRQNCQCKDTKTEKLKSHVPAEDFTLIICWPDENNILHFSQEISLANYLNGIKPMMKESSAEPPYIIQTKVIEVLKYNPNYGDHRVCKCGHPYYRHFDSYEDNAPVGCKYCSCYTFAEETELVER